MNAFARAHQLLDRSRISVPITDDQGFIDLLPTDTGYKSVPLRVMRVPAFAAVYERAWRPFFTRLFSLGGADTAVADRELTESLLPAGTTQTVLDVGCGPGNYTRRFAASLAVDSTVIGLDFSEVMLARAVEGRSAESLAYVRGDAHNIPFPDNTFDVVTCFAALYLIPDPLPVVAELLRVTKPGGKVAIFTTVESRLSDTVPVVRNALARAGFKIFGRDEITNEFSRVGAHDITQKITGEGQFVWGTKQ